MVALSVVVAACAGDAVPPAVTVIDSAGITITLSPDLGATYASVDPEPLVSLGGPDAEGPEQFYVITGVQLDSDGRVWISDYQSGELRVFDAAGAHLFTRGGPGAGPGEFTGIRLLGVHDDNVWVADVGSGRLSVYDTGGELVRTERLQFEGRAFPRPFDVYSDGSVLGQVPTVYASRALLAGQLLPAQVRLGRFFASREPRPLVEGLEGAPFLWTGKAMVAIPFMANAAFALRGDELHLAAGPEFRVRVYDGDRLLRIYGVERSPQPVTQRDVQDYRQRILDAYPADQAADFLSALDHPAVPDVLPAYTRLLVASDGSVWIRRYRSDSGWDVYDGAGALLGGVGMPADFDARSIRDGRVAGVWLDGLDVEHIRVYAVVRISDE